MSIIEKIPNSLITVECQIFGHHFHGHGKHFKNMLSQTEHIRETEHHNCENYDRIFDI